MRDLINILIFFCALKFACFEGSVPAFVIVVLLSVIYAIKYFRLKINEKSFNNKYDKLWNNFIELLNHDLKIPTLAQLRALEIIEHNNCEDMMKEELFLQIKKSCKCTLDMISTVIEAYKFENNSARLLYERFNMTELITNCFEYLSLNAMEKNITFAYNLNVNDSYIEADREELRKVIINLLTNAINYADRGKQVTVTISGTKSNLNVSLSGKEFAQNLLNDSRYSTIGQSIEMYLCKKIIEIHKGKFYVAEDEKDDKMVTFSIPKTHTSIYN